MPPGKSSNTLCREAHVYNPPFDVVGVEVDGLREISRRLDAVIYLLMNLKRFESISAEDRILELRTLGFSDTEVARIIGRTRGYVASAVSRGRRKNREAR